MSRRLRKYLEAIAATRPVNLRAFLAEAELQGIPRASLAEGLRSERERGDLYRVRIVDIELERRLASLALADEAGRAAAAATGRSHRVSVEGSFLLRRTLAGHPEVLVFDGAGGFSPAGAGRWALVIENRQNFLSIEAGLTVLDRLCGLRVTAEFDIIYGAGREIANHLHRNYLAGFERVYLWGDLDAGGLSIARSLMAGLPDTPVEFLLPADAAERLGQGRPATAKCLDEVFRLASECPALAPAAKLILDSRRTLEQESYLI